VPKSQLDWLGIASLWLGAFILALKSASFELITGAPSWLAAEWWNLVPLLLISVYLLLALRKITSAQKVVALPPDPSSQIAPKLPGFADPQVTKWPPDVTFLEAMLYMHREARWGQIKRRTPEVIRETLIDALATSRITSWGRSHPEEPEYQIRSRFWGTVEITLDSNCVFSKSLNIAAYEVRLCSAQLKAMWPPNDEPPNESAA
jgi:hypothetical protein